MMEINHINEESAGIIINDYDELNERVGIEGWDTFKPGETFIGTVTVLKIGFTLTTFTVRIDWNIVNVPKGIVDDDYTGLYLRKEKKKIDWVDLLLMNETIKIITEGDAYPALRKLKYNGI